MVEKTVLIIDDDVNALETAVSHLHQSGITTTIVSDEISGWQHALQQPALILLTITLPGTNSLDLCQRLKAHEQTQHIPILFTITAPDHATITAIFKAGGADYINKPFFPQELLARVQTHLALSQTQPQSDILQAENKYRAFFDNAHDSIFIIDPKTRRFIDANENAPWRLGYTHEELLQLNLDDIYAPITAKKNEEIIQTLLQVGDIRFEHACRHKDGHVMPVEITSRLITIGNEQVFHSVARDISERRQIETDLSQSKQLLEATFSCLQDAIFIIDSKTIEIIECNLAATKTFGYSHEELVGTKITELHINKETSQLFSDILLPSIQENGFLLLPEFQMKHKDGTIFPTEHNVFPLHNDAGEITHRVNIIRDISKQKKVTQALYESTERYRTLVETADDVILLTDLEGKYIFRNKAYYTSLGFQEGDIIDHDKYSRIHPDDKPILDKGISDLLAHGSAHAEYRMQHKDGHWLHRSTKFVMVTDDNEQLQSILAIARDITEQKTSEERLRISEERYRTLVDHIPDGIYVLNSNWDYVIVNEAAASVTQIPVKEYIGRNLLDLFPEFPETEIFKKMDQVMNDRVPRSIFEKYIFENGRSGYYNVRIFPVPDGIMCISTDETSRKQIEDTLYFTAQRGWTLDTKSFFDSLAQHLGHTLGADYVLIGELCNKGRSIQTIATYAHGDIIENITYDLAGTPCSNVTDQELCCYTQGVQQLFPKDHLLVEMGVEGYIGIPLWDATGNPLGIVAILTCSPITNQSLIDPILQIIAVRASHELERQQAKIIIQESEENFRAFFNSVEDFLFVFDEQGIILKANNASIHRLGYQEQELIGQSVLAVHPENRSEEAKILLQAVIAGTRQSCPIPLQTKTGDLVSVDTRITCGHWSGKKAFFSISKDISQIELSEEKFQRAFHGNPVGMAINTVANGQFVDVNDAFVKMTGYEREEVIGHTSTELNLSPDPDQKNKVVEIYQQTGVIKNLPLIYRTKMGELKYSEFSLEIIDIQHQKYLLTMMTDVTERRKAKIDLELNKTRFEILYKLSQMIDATDREIKDFALDASVQVTNSTIGYIYFMTEDESTLILHAWSKDVMTQCDVVEIQTIYKVEETGLWGECVRRREPVITNDYEAPNPLKKGYPEGHVPVKRHMNIPLMDNGKIVLIAGVGNKEEPYDEADIHQLTLVMDGMWRIIKMKHAEKSLRESENKYRLLIENQNDLVIKFNADKQLTFVSPSYCQTFGKSEDELLGNIFIPLIHEDSQEIVQQSIAKLATPPHTCQHEELAMTTEGWRWFSWSNRALVDDKGQIQEIIAVGREITDRKEAEMQVKQLNAQLEQKVQKRTKALTAANEALQKAKDEAETANRAKSAFLANMSHELRTPLNAILGFTQLVRRDTTVSLVRRNQLEIIEQNGEHLLELINDVLTMSKIEAGHIALEESDFDLYRLLNDLEQLFQARAYNRNLKLRFELAPDLPQYIHTDKRKLRQILINLLSNAIKFTNSGHIVLRVSYELPANADRAVSLRYWFEIEDTGAGIAPEEMDALFTAFSQTASGREIQDGTGLGLPISCNFVHLMGGDITVSSAVAKGSTFRFSILANATETIPPPPSPAYKSKFQPIKLAPNQKEYRILVVEDNVDNRHMLVELLSGVGFKVRWSENGREAIAVWQSWQPHLIWMDIRMPIMDGHEATKRIKSLPGGKETIIIALTAHAFEDMESDAIHAGCDDFMRKPFRETELYDKLSYHLGVKYSVQALPEGNTDINYTLTPADLENISSEWVVRLHQSATKGQSQQSLKIIEEIYPTKPVIAKALANLVHEFRFDKLVALTRQAGGE